MRRFWRFFDPGLNYFYLGLDRSLESQKFEHQQLINKQSSINKITTTKTGRGLNNRKGYYATLWRSHNRDKNYCVGFRHI